MIKKLKKIRHGIFKDFKWPEDLPEFQDYNLIYGWNGTGKTTLAELLRSFEKGTPPPKDVLQIEDEHGRPATSLAVKAFTRDFVENTVFSSGGTVAPIFFLGVENAAKSKEMETLESRQGALEEKASAADNQLRSSDRAIDKLGTDVAKGIRDRLSSNGPNPYNKYTRANYKKTATKIRKSRTDHTLSAERLRALNAELNSRPKDPISALHLDLPDPTAMDSYVRQTLAEKITSNAIQRLEEDPKANAWVSQGLKLHRDRQAKACLFCLQTLPENLLPDLEAHFNEEYKRFLNKVNEQISRLGRIKEEIRQLALPEKGDFHEGLRNRYAQERQNLQQQLEHYSNRLNEYIRALQEKHSAPFTEPSLDMALTREAPAAAVSMVIAQLNELIAEHNDIGETFQTSISASRQAIEYHYVAESLEEYDRLALEKTRCKTDLETHNKSLEETRAAIAALDRDLREHRQPADEVNKDLSEYLGHNEIRFATQDAGYTILRQGQLAEKLSEGERTAIALLYFLKSLEDKNFDLESSIVVLDDPMSSLDQNALYNAFSFIQARTRKAGQLFVLTHSFAFFRQVRNWFQVSHARSNGRTAEFYSIRCVDSDGSRASTMTPLDTVLRDYNSEYHFLFKQVYQCVKGQRAVSAQTYQLPNIARRLLEIFLSFWKPASGTSFYKRIHSSGFDSKRIDRIYQYVNTFSHGEDFSPDSERDMSILGESSGVLKDVLDFIEHESNEHFRRMEKLVKASG